MCGKSGDMDELHKKKKKNERNKAVRIYTPVLWHYGSQMHDKTHVATICQTFSQQYVRPSPLRSSGHRVH